MSNAKRSDRTTCSVTSCKKGREDADHSANPLTSAAEYERIAAQEVAPALRAPLWNEIQRTRAAVRARKLTPGAGLRRSAMLAVAATMLTSPRAAAGGAA